MTMIGSIGELFRSPFSIPIFISVAGVAGWVCVTAVVQWRKAREAAYNARLKQLMIEQGMSADEIERVLIARAPLDDEDDDE